MGLNFAPVPTEFPLQDTIAGMEETTRKLPKEDLPQEFKTTYHKGAAERDEELEG